jgi:hypothetical protein
MNYTDLPDRRKDRLRFVDTANAVTETSGQIRLHENAVVSDQDSARRSELRSGGILVRGDLGSPPVCVVQIRPAGQEQHVLSGIHESPGRGPQGQSLVTRHDPHHLVQSR